MSTQIIQIHSNTDLHECRELQRQPGHLKDQEPFDTRKRMLLAGKMILTGIYNV